MNWERIKRKVRCFFGDHEMKPARFHMGSYINKRGGLNTMIVHGQECIHCGYQEPIDDFIHCRYEGNDYVRRGYNR